VIEKILEGLDKSGLYLPARIESNFLKTHYSCQASNKDPPGESCLHDQTNENEGVIAKTTAVAGHQTFLVKQGNNPQ